MYIPEFWCGVIATVLLEIGLVIVCFVISAYKDGKGKK